MMGKEENLLGCGGGNVVSRKAAKVVFLVVFFLTLACGLSAQSTFPAGDYWSVDMGIGMSGILVEGESFQIIVDPRLWLSPQLMVGSKVGINYSTDSILTFEGQVYLRWNFLRFGSGAAVGSLFEKTTNIFIQGGMGMLAAYRGNDMPLDNVRRTRGSLLFDAAIGVTIPLTPRWHIEPSIRGGYPHIAGFSITAGYKFPLPEKTKYQQLPGKKEYVEIIKTVPPQEIIKRTVIDMIEYILFGPDIGTYNEGIDHDAESLNELVLNEIALILGVDHHLVTFNGYGGTQTVVTYNPSNLASAELNRRVEIIVIEVVQ